MTDELLKRGLEHGFIDKTITAGEEFTPQLITNNPLRNEKVITTLKHEMENCDEFMFSVAFVNSGGVSALDQEFLELDRRGIKGRIIASQYQNFTEPVALKKLTRHENIQVRIITEEVSKMHSKCYIFRHGDSYNIIIGSSNLTNGALCENMEWNLKFNSMQSGELVSEILSEFERMFEIATPVDDIWIGQYSMLYDDIHEFRRSMRDHNPRLPDTTGRISPNKMQVEALIGIQKIRDSGENRALVISATGSGKTYLSAFDVKRTEGRFLYIVHRNPILNKSKKSFERVLEGKKTVARYDPAKNNLDADCTFVTIQTISKPDVLAKIPQDWFDYILIDEVHHAGAETYQKVLNHFTPKFLLGMTATPDRTDGYDIYKLFNYQIAYEIRLKGAMENKLICPFHYFGISDISFDGESEEEKSAFLKTEFEQRLNHILFHAEYYGYCGNRVKGLVFCRDLNEAQDYSEGFNRRGYRTVKVDGKMDKDEVEAYIERLEEDDESKAVLDYIFTADLFNEGVDIPSVNQVIMLRPTESPIIFIQQLGRGLRHYPDKEYVVILDFIGNYEKNYNIPLALSDDRSYSKSETRRFVASGDSIIPGNSTISFDEVSRNKIYESIDNSDFTEAKIILDAYRNLKMRLGRIPRLTEFGKHDSIDALNILTKYRSYHAFLKTREKEYTEILSKTEESYLELITRICAAGKRQIEIEAVSLLVDGTEDMIGDLCSRGFDTEQSNIIQVLDGTFYSNDISLIDDITAGIQASEQFRKMLSDDSFRDHIIQIIDLGRENWSRNYSEPCKDSDLVLNMRYTYEDVCRYLNWSKNINAQNLGGYFYHKDTNTFPVFINYIKGDDVAESQRYEDRFENRNTLIALSKSNENRNSSRMKVIENSSKTGTKIHLFMRKNKNDKGSKEFYYLGPMSFVSFLDDNKPVTIEYKLMFEVRSDLYDYFNSEA